MMREVRFLDHRTADLADPTEDAAEQRSGPGVIVFTIALQLVHMNHQATEICKELSHCNSIETPITKLPAPIHEFGNEVRSMLRARTGEVYPEQLQIRQLISDARQPVLLRGYGLLDQACLEQSLILIMMEKVRRRQESSTAHAKGRFCLTTREESVVHQLTKGLTNKEIAHTLRISEQTVKEHIKHIMHKTGTTTRTGILSRILHLQPEVSSESGNTR
jgi:DNA-binding CsgD family transcriptional regulator